MDADRVDGEPPATSLARARSRPRSKPRWRRKRWAFPGIAVLVLVAIVAIAWTNRTRIADDFLQDQLAAYDLPATYRIEQIGPQTQVIGDLVVGDPADPDFTARRAIVRLRHGFGLPEIESVELIEPRVFGRFVDGRISFGALDSLIYRETEEPGGLPDLDLTIRDGRGRIASPYGAVGFKLEGSGNLAEEFSGILAATAPGFAIADCSAERLTAYGRVELEAGAPRFSGPLRVRGVNCGAEAAVSSADVQLDLRAGADLAAPRFTARVASGAARYGANTVGGVTGTVRGQVSGGQWSTRYMLAARGLDTPQASAALATLEGSARSLPGNRIEVETRVEGNGLRLGRNALAAMNGVVRGADETFLAPLVQRFAEALQRQARGSALSADVRFRKSGDSWNLIVPQAELTGGAGERIMSLSRVELARAGQGGRPTLSGNLALAGTGLPRISGRMERSAGGSSVFRLRMEPYAAGRSRLAVPDLVVRQAPNGALAFAGNIAASGALPGGEVEDLRLPVSGRLGAGGELALWEDCITPRFASLRYANLRLRGQAVQVCPAPGRPILAYGDAGLRFAAGAPSLDLVGTLAATPIRLRTGAIGMAYPGVLRAAEVDVALGPPDRPTRFTISDLDARLGSDLGGTFADAEVTLPAVPLDIVEASGEWRYNGGVLSLSDGAFRLLDRQAQDRFEPLIARDARLRLENNVITAEADLLNPASERLVLQTDIGHDLADGTGFADLSLPGILFDEGLQPDQLSRLALGVVANVRGAVSGTGRIDWSPSGDVRSTGAFSSDDLDFAAAFGPVRGASGTIVFDDLLGLTTAPGQTLRVASVNPGIEVTDGEVAFGLRGGEVLAVEGGSWPFMGGRLILRETNLNIGLSEERRYVFEIVGLEAAQFVAQLDLENIAATGTFDGVLPIVFDRNGDGRIEEGLLISRPPGGNVSYVGELTYEDLSPIANFAFDALRSLDYNRMTIGMDGPLTGEIVTRVRFDGVSQGEGAKRNFITRRLAALPLQFRINLRAPFYKLISSLKSLYDPSAVRDPRSLGLLSDDGRRLLREEITDEEVEEREDREEADASDDSIEVPPTPVIQTEESEEGP